MPREHSGGAPDVGFESTDEDPGHPIKIDQFDFGSLDSLADLIRDCEYTGEKPWNVVREVFRSEIDALICQALRSYRDLLAPAARKQLAAAQLDWAIAETLVHDEKQLKELARRFGISKQAFEQGGQKFQHLLGIRSQTRRTDDAKAKMRSNNYRQRRLPRDHQLAEMFNRPGRDKVRPVSNIPRVGRTRKAG